MLGLIPIKPLREIAAAMLGRFSPKPLSPSGLELDPYRPIIWAWVLPTLAFSIRYITWGSARNSVLGTLTHSNSAFQHFFGIPMQELSQEWLGWFYDRLFFTEPMLFLCAYSLAVVLRHWLSSILPLHPEQLPVLKDSSSDPR